MRRGPLPQGTYETKLWAAAHLEGLSTLYQLEERTLARERVCSNGDLMRHAFNIIVVPEAKTSAFLVRLFKGAEYADVQKADAIIRQLKAGNFDSTILEQIDPTPTTPYTRYVFTLAVKADPNRNRLELHPCKVEGCIENFHGWDDDFQDDPCWTEAIDHPSGRYRVRGYKYHGERWEADATHEADCFPSGPEGLKVVRDLANDLAWVQGECDRLNAEWKAAA